MFQLRLRTNRPVLRAVRVAAQPFEQAERLMRVQALSIEEGQNSVDDPVLRFGKVQDFVHHSPKSELQTSALA